MYSAFCLQNNDYFHTGRNSESKRQCMEDILDHLYSGCDCGDCTSCNHKSPSDLNDKDLEYEIGCWEVAIHYHTDPIEQSVQLARAEAIKELLDIQKRKFEDMNNKQLADEWNDTFCAEEDIIVIN